jgi:hypothetical protein
MSYGEWTNMTSRDVAMALCSYNYRMTPLGIWDSWHRYEDGQGGYWFPAMRPRVNARITQPMFRTHKEVNGRAVAVDTFTKGEYTDGLGRTQVPGVLATQYSDPIASSRNIAGYGVKAHIDGYHVLYGNCNVKWFGDPQQKFVWHTQGQDTVAYGGTFYPHVILSTWLFRHCFWYSTNIAGGYWAHNPYSMWHELDVEGGVDL